jgi:type II secretory pathway component PulF
MAIWRYKAIPLTSSHGATSRSVGRQMRVGEHSGESAAEVRSALRSAGWQVIDVRPAFRLRLWPKRIPGQEIVYRYLRRRRQSRRGELFDGLATMLESGLPMIEAIDAQIECINTRHSSIRRMLVQVREAVHNGHSLADAVANEPGWFDSIEHAMIRAGQHSGMLPSNLKRMQDRIQRSESLQGRLIGVLSYPILVLLIAIGVTMFLSVNTLPDLTKMLTEAEIEVPRLTAAVMAFGQFVAGNWYMF